MRRLLAIVVAIAVAGGAFVATGADEGAQGKKYFVVLDNAFGLTEGGELKIGGVTAGAVRDFELTDDDPVKVAVEIEVTESGFDNLREDAECGVRQQSLIGEYFLDCQMGRGEPLPSGGTVPVEQTNSTIPMDLVQTVMRRPYRERFRLILSELGAGLAGRPEELNEVIRRAHPGLRETTETLEILARHNRIIANFIRNADRVSHAVAQKRRNVIRWAKESSETAAVQASRRDDLQRNWNRLPVFLNELRPTMNRLQLAADEQIPLLRRLRTAAPRLEGFLAALGPFAQASRGSIRALGDAAVTGRRAIAESPEEVEQLRRLGRWAPRLGKPLRQLLQSIDDRSRSIEEDPLARQTAPPAPDKTAYRDGQGFTGMEAVWNYFYYQAQAVNAFDEVSHVLRIVAIQSPCAPYNPLPTEKQVKECGAWFGPNQPGINQPDPTEGPALRRSRAPAPEPQQEDARSQLATEAEPVLDYLLAP